MFGQGALTSTPVLSATLTGCSNEKSNDTEPFKYRLQSFQPKEAARACVAFNEQTNIWSTFGLEVVEAESNETITTCLSTHLTNFAVLTQVDSDSSQNSDHDTALSVITTVCCVISMVALLLTMIIYAYLPKVRKGIISHLLLCLCFILFVAFFLFILASYVEPGKGCEAVGAMLQVSDSGVVCTEEFMSRPAKLALAFCLESHCHLLDIIVLSTPGFHLWPGCQCTHSMCGATRTMSLLLVP